MTKFIDDEAEVMQQCGKCGHRWLEPEQGIAALLDFPHCPNCGSDNYIISNILPAPKSKHD